MKVLSKNMLELLKLFYTNPGKDFYMHEIGRILHKKPGVFQRILNSLAEEGILISEYRANSRYFRADRSYPLFKELESIISKSAGVAVSLEKVLRKITGIDYAFIYGSFASKKENLFSDIDVFIIGRPDEGVLVKKINVLETEFQREINYKIYHRDIFKKEIRRKNPFILNILKEKKNMLIGEEDELRKISAG